MVAAAEPEICDVVTNAGGKAVLTDPDLPSGSDRVWQAVQTLDPQGQYSTIINLQGDLPTLAPDALHTVCGVMDNPAFDIGTLVAPVSTEEEATAPSVVKVACHFAQAAHHALALYFSRQPFPRAGASMAPCRDLRMAAGGSGPLCPASSIWSGTA